MPEILDAPPPQNVTPVISDAPPPQGVTAAGSQISDAPPPGVTPVAGWQAKVVPVKLKSGAETVLRPDGFVWLDKSKGHDKEGWFTPDLWGGWKKGPDAPKNYKETNDPKEMGDAQIATQLLGMTPEQYLDMSNAATYKPGDMQLILKMKAPAQNDIVRSIQAPGRSITLGAEQGAQNIVSLAMKPLSWLGNKSPELWSQAQSKLLQIAQNQSQSRPALEGGFDPLHTLGQFAIGRGPNVTSAAPGTAAAVAATGRQVALEEGAQLAGRETPSFLAKAGDIYKAAIPEAIKSSGVVAATTDGSVPKRVEAGLAAGIAQPLVETGVGTVLAPGIQKLFNFAKGLRGKGAPLPGKAGDVEALGDLWDVDTPAHNLVENPSSQIRTLGEHATAAPIGSLGPENVAQQAQATRAVTNFQNQLKTKMMKAGYDNFGELSAAAKRGEKQAVVLWNLANDAGNDLPKVIAVNGNINRWAAQQKVNRLAEDAIASDTGALAGAEEMAPALTTVDRLIKEHGPETVGEANVNKPLLDYLKRVKKDLTTKNVKATMEANGSGDSAASMEAINRVAQEQELGRPRAMVDLRTGQVTPVPASVDAVDQFAAPNTVLVQKGVGKDPEAWTVLNTNSKAPQAQIDAAMARVRGSLAAWEKANPVEKVVADKGSDFKATYTGIANYRKGIQQKRQALGTPGSELTGNDATKALKELQMGIEQTQELTSNLSPGTAAKDRLMRDTHLAEVVPFKKRALINLLSTETPDVIANRMTTMTEDQLAEIIPQLGEKGKAAARLHMVTKAIDQAMDRSNPNPLYQFQPIEFAKKMTDPKFAAAVGATIPKGGEGRWTLNGLVELMGHLQTAGKTSSAEGAYTLSRRVVSTPAAAMKWLLTTKPGKQLLLQASDLKAGSPQFAALVDRIDKLMPAEIGKAVSTEEDQ